MNSPRFALSLLASVNLILLTIISAAPVVAQGAAPPRAVSPDQIAPYMKPHRLIRIAGGRTINLVCLGQGSPTVILTAGLGGWSYIWNRIQCPLSRRSRVCAWDPAGLGFSSPSPEPQDAIHETEDLEEALKRAHIEGPYVMVAHSAGAYVALRFTDQQRKTVVGMVLVDPSIPDETAIRDRVAPKFAAFGDAAPQAAVKRMRQCAAELRSGALKRGAPGFQPVHGSTSTGRLFTTISAPRTTQCQSCEVTDCGIGG
jgi:pimeloyl-ACP methyl ester carboxylesterase